MSAARPRVTVAVLCRDDADLLELTLDDLFAQTETAWEAVVVDNGSVDEDARVRLARMRWPNTRCLREAAAAPGAAARSALAAAAADALLFLQAGDRLAPSALGALHGALDADPEAMVALPAAPGSGRRPGLARRSALSAWALESDDPAGRLVAAGARCATVDEPLVRPVAARTRASRPAVRARSLVTTQSAPVAEPFAASPPAAGAPAGALELSEAVRRIDELASALREARHDIAALRASASWRITAPLRLLHRLLVRGGR